MCVIFATCFKTNCISAIQQLLVVCFLFWCVVSDLLSAFIDALALVAGHASLFPLLPLLAIARGDPIDHRRCQSLLHPYPEPQAPARHEW